MPAPAFLTWQSVKTWRRTRFQTLHLKSSLPHVLTVIVYSLRCVETIMHKRKYRPVTSASSYYKIAVDFVLVYFWRRSSYILGAMSHKSLIHVVQGHCNRLVLFPPVVTYISYNAQNLRNLFELPACVTYDVYQKSQVFTLQLGRFLPSLERGHAYVFLFKQRWHKNFCDQRKLSTVSGPTVKIFCVFIMLVSRKLDLYWWKSGNVDNVIAATTTANQPLIKS